MRRTPFLSAICVLAICLAATAAEPPESIGPRLQRISVNITCPGSGYSGGAQGSGTLILAEVGGKTTTWVLTANHVVKGLREVKDVIGPGGEEKKQVRYRDARIIQEQVQNGRGVGEQTYDAKIINVDPRRDIALLRVRIDKFADDGAVFYRDDAIPQPGTAILHCGSPGGKETGGTCSLTSGIISRIGVRIPEFGGSEHGVFDQTDTAALGGSSGGLIALQDDGRWVGMITLGLRGGDSFHWIVPIRSVRAWAKAVKVEWLLDPKITRPSETDIQQIPLELDPPGFKSAASTTPTPAPAEKPAFVELVLPGEQRPITPARRQPAETENDG